MSRTKASEKSTPWWSHAVSSVPRCHALGSVVSIALVICIAWSWSRSQVGAQSVELDGKVVDLNEANALIENADQWRQLYTANYRRSQAVDQRCSDIASWLPTAVDWKSTENDIRSIGDSAGLSIRSIKQGEQHVGTRVGVIVATCVTEGSYNSLCRFLSAASHRDQPLACSEITLRRVDSRDHGEPTQVCNATITFRIPFAAPATDAGRLLLLEEKNAS